MNKTNVERIREQFEGIQNKVSREDKDEAARDLGVHPTTVLRYLRGQIAKEPFALELLAILKNKIVEREKVLTN